MFADLFTYLGDSCGSDVLGKGAEEEVAKYTVNGISIVCDPLLFGSFLPNLLVLPAAPPLLSLNTFLAGPPGSPQTHVPLSYTSPSSQETDSLTNLLLPVSSVLRNPRSVPTECQYDYSTRKTIGHPQVLKVFGWKMWKMLRYIEKRLRDVRSASRIKEQTFTSIL